MPRASAARPWTAGVAALAMMVAGACGTHEPPVVARGRWVELATDRDDPICAGTIDFLDGIVGEGFKLIGETPPDHVFIRYEWLEGPLNASRTWPVDDGILIRTDQLVEEHELAHAVHLTAWPRSARFMHEGFAVLLDGRRIQYKSRWPKDLPLDEILASPIDPGLDYLWAWFLVSQIVRDHGIDGLRDLWFAVPSGAGAAEVRAAYQALFGQSMDALLEPVTEVVQDVDLEVEVEVEVERQPCLFALCAGDPVSLDGVSGTEILAPGPSGCEDDPGADGPYSRGVSIDGPPVWRTTIIEATDSPIIVQGSAVLGARMRPCWLWCDERWQPPGQGVWLSPPSDGQTQNLPPGRWRIEASRALEDLPTNEPGSIQIVAHEP